MRLLFLLSLLLVQNAYAQSVLRFQHINVEDGLSQSSVNHIFQDSHGFIWFATGDGLNRYDGKQFIAYKSQFNDTLSGSVKDRNINSKLFEDRYNRIWFTSDAGISFKDTHTGLVRVILDKYRTACSGNLHGIDTVIWVSVPHNGIYSIRVSDLKTSFYPFTDKHQASRDINTILSVAATGKELWMADNEGLICFDKKTHKDSRRLLKKGLISIEVLQNGKILLGAAKGVWLYEPNNEHLEFIEINEPATSKPIAWNTCTEDQLSGIIYLGSLYGGHVCRLDLADRKQELLSFQNTKINDLFIDNSENLWIGTDGDGVYKMDIKQPKFSCFGSKSLYNESEQNNFMVKSIYPDDKGKIWMGVFNNGIIIYDPAKQIQEKVNIPISGDNQLISTIIKDSVGNIVTSIGNKLLWLDAASHKVLHETTLPPVPEMPGSQPIIYALTEWKSGHYLVGTNFGTYVAVLEGTARSWMPKSFHHDSLISAWPYNCYRANGSIVYMGLRRGFVKMQMVSDSEYHLIDNGFRDIPVRHFYKSRTTPVLWIASEKGLIAYNENTKHYKVFDETSGLANSYIYSILDQDDSSLWISTNNGLANVHVSYGKGDDIKATFTNYSVKDGLQSNEFNTGSYYKDHNGILYFGGIAGINWFDPAKMNANHFKARPAISAICINDSLYAGDTAIYVQQITVPYDRNTISFTLSALEFTRPGQNVFSYKLEGSDKDWVSTTNDNVRYSNLPPGTYHFLLRVSNNDGVWNNDPLQLTITVLPPWWHTWWFTLFLLLVSVLIIYLSVRFYVRQKIKVRTKELEQQQALYLERLRISKDVHDDLGSGLSKISLMAAIAQKKTAGNAPLNNDIQHISTVSKELVDNMRDLIWVLNPENTTLEQLVSRLREYCADYLENIPVSITLSFPASVPDIRISREVQRNIFLTVKEAVNNCIKHADASALSISLTIDATQMSIEITDNGRGFDTIQIKGGGNGLRNMKQRITSIGGSFTITSSLGGHTTILIIISIEQLRTDKNTTLV